MEKTNCPNCSAPITDLVCPYCGTIIHDFVNIEAGRPTYIRFRHNGIVGVYKAFCKTVEIRQEMAQVFYADNLPIAYMPEATISMELLITG